MVLYFVVNYFTKNISGKPFNLIDPSTVFDTKPKKNPLGEVVEKVLADSQGDYAAVVKNLKTGETYSRNENKSYETGSLYKLWVMAAAFKQIQEGILTEDEVLSDSVVNLNQEFGISSSDAELTDGTITLIVGDALTQMITISHNYAAMLLTDKIKLSAVSDFLKLNNLTSSALGNGNDLPKSTASDISLFLEKLYRGELADPINTNKMLDILKAQTFDNGLPKYLPKETVIANKTGDIDWFKHDAGIIFTDNGDYVIVVMSESESPVGAQERIALISKAVYEYFKISYNKKP